MGERVAPRWAHELRIVKQHRPAPPALPIDVQVFIVRGEIEIVDVDLQRFADAQPRFHQQPEQQLVAERRSSRNIAMASGSGIVSISASFL